MLSDRSIDAGREAGDRGIHHGRLRLRWPLGLCLCRQLLWYLQGCTDRKHLLRLRIQHALRPGPDLLRLLTSDDERQIGRDDYRYGEDHTGHPAKRHGTDATHQSCIDLRSAHRDPQFRGVQCLDASDPLLALLNLRNSRIISGAIASLLIFAIFTDEMIVRSGRCHERGFACPTQISIPSPPGFPGGFLVTGTGDGNP